MLGKDRIGTVRRGELRLVFKTEQLISDRLSALLHCTMMNKSSVYIWAISL